MRLKYLLLLIGLALGLGSVGLGLHYWPAAGQNQPPSQPEVAGKKDAPERSAPDAKKPWDLKEGWSQLAGDAPVWRRKDVTDPHKQFLFDLLAERLQVTNGEITKEQFLVLTQRPAGERPAETARANTGAPKPKADEPPTPGAQPAAHDEGPPDPRAAARFRALDVNGDGLLTFDEMDEALRAERDKWDTNQDGFIDLEEFRAYFKARWRPLFHPREQKAKAPPRVRPAPEPPAAPSPALVATSAALSAINLSGELPEEYRKFDTDHDGQIGLYEWKAAGMPIAKFHEKDLNGDGFLTPDELAPPVEADNKNSPNGEPDPDPGSLVAFQGQVGKVFRFRVTGAAAGGVWGSNPYTADSSLAVAAVHAGAVAVGETKTVRVRIVQPPPSFEGSTANGITTQPFAQFPGAYRVMK